LLGCTNRLQTKPKTAGLTTIGRVGGSAVDAGDAWLVAEGPTC
jgi:hypothetical protein